LKFQFFHCLLQIRNCNITQFFLQSIQKKNRGSVKNTQTINESERSSRVRRSKGQAEGTGGVGCEGEGVAEQNNSLP
jgi:hypothetical protein